MFITIQFSKKTTVIQQRPHFDPALLCKRGTSAGKIHFFELLFIWKKIKISDHLHGKGLRLHKMQSGK